MFEEDFPSLPHSLEAEQGLLGSMLISPVDVIGECVERINAAYFYRSAHSTIYGVLVEFWGKETPADTITLTQTLRDRNQLDAVGGPAYLSSLMSFTPTAANAEHYLQIVEAKYKLRGLITICRKAVVAGYGHVLVGDVDVLTDTIAQLEALKDNGRKDTKAKTMREHVSDQIDAIQVLYENRGKISGLSSGFRELDRLTDGLQPTDLIVLAGRPSMGKSSIAMQIAEHVALREKRAVGVFSLEMSAGQLTRRMLCSHGRVNLQKLRDGFLTERDFSNLANAASRMAEAGIHIDDTAALTIQTLQARAQRMERQHGIKLVIIDQATQMRSSTARASENRQQEVAEITAGAKAMAKNLNLPVILLAHINRLVESRRSNRPRLADLRESGSLEQDADLVLFIHRPEYYAEEESAKEQLRGLAELIIAKQRNGPVDDVALTFLHEFTRFEDRAHEPSK